MLAAVAASIGATDALKPSLVDDDFAGVVVLVGTAFVVVVVGGAVVAGRRVAAVVVDGARVRVAARRAPCPVTPHAASASDSNAATTGARLTPR